MGMQATFNLDDLPEDAKTQFVVTLPADDEYPYDLEIVVITIDGITESFGVISYTEENPGYRKHAWFDCGSCSAASMNMIRWLIRNRIPFTCA